MRIYTFLVLSVLLAVPALAAVPGLNDNFDGYANGATFVAPVNNWQGSSSWLYVTNSGAYSGKGVYMEDETALTNSVAADAGLKVWTDMRLKPTLGVEMTSPPTNASSFLCYFSSNGYVMVATPTGWRMCTNDVWGNAIPPATNNAYVRLSLYQDYASSTQAVFLNERLLVQDLPFPGSVGAYTRLEIENKSGSCWLDNAWAKTNAGPDSFTASYNGDGLADATEVALYGYARRTLYVCQTATNLVTVYSSITNAVAACRSRDIIHVIAGNYSGEAVTLGANLSNVVFEGDAFSLNSLTVPLNASVSFSQSLSCVTLTLNGQVALAQSTAITSVTANVVGTLSLASNSAFVATGTLSVTGAGLLSFTEAQLVANASGVNMTGTFAISNTWGSATIVSMPLPFSDDFESYAQGTIIANLKFRGWDASAGTVSIQTNQGFGSSKAVSLPELTTLTNSLSAAGVTKTWMDFQIRPTLGVEPVWPATNTSSYLAYANSNGFLVVAVNGGGWVVCSNQINGITPPLLNNNDYTRISVFQDFSFTPPKFSVFIGGNLVAQQLVSPAAIGSLSKVETYNHDGTAYLDAVLITTNPPADLTSDLDGDGIPDATELALYGNTYAMSRGSVYLVR